MTSIGIFFNYYSQKYSKRWYGIFYWKLVLQVSNSFNINYRQPMSFFSSAPRQILSSSQNQLFLNDYSQQALQVLPFDNNNNSIDSKRQPQSKNNDGSKHQQQYAPFSSRTSRPRNPLLLSNQDKLITPGPGCYQIDKRPVPHTEILINNRKLVVKGKEQYQSVFNSRTQRFTHHTNAKEGSYVPGPGEQQHTQNKTTNTPSRPFIPNRATSTTKLNKSRSDLIPKSKLLISSLVKERVVVPSIPVNIVGYREAETGGLEVLKKEFNEAPGPGSYNPLHTSIISQQSKEESKPRNKLKGSRSVINWKLTEPGNIHNSRSIINEITTKKSNPRLGPGTYFKQPLQSAEKSKINTSTVSDKATKTVTSCFKSATKKLQEPPQNLTPGPGAYSQPSSALRNNSRSKLKTSHFGSTITRFDSKAEVEAAPGPGAYTSESVARSLRSRSTAAFNSTSRKGEFLAVTDKVGPGSYELEEAFLKNYSKSKNTIIGFEQRFRETTDSNSKEKAASSGLTPGPGDYDSHILYSTSHTSMAKGGVLIKPKSQPLIKKSEEVTPDPMTYTVDNHTISKKIKPTASHIAQFAVKHPFNAGAPRFDYNKNIRKQEGEEKTILMASIGGIKDKYLVRQPFVPKQTVPFGSSTQRRTTPKNKVNNLLEAPGPGDYNLESTLLKRTFNTKGFQMANN